MTAQDKLNNLETLHKTLGENPPPVTVDEDGFYYIGDQIFTDFKTALRSIKKD
jgi:hypothetical protein